MAIEPVKSRYKANRRFDPATYFNDIVGVTRPENAVVETVSLRVDAKTAPYLKTRPIHHSQRLSTSDPTGTVYQYTLIPNYEFISEVLRLGDSAQLLFPDSLREAIAKKIYHLNSMYHD